MHKSIHVPQSDVWAAHWAAYKRTHSRTHTLTHVPASLFRSFVPPLETKCQSIFLCLCVFFFMLCYPNCLLNYRLHTHTHTPFARVTVNSTIDSNYLLVRDFLYVMLFSPNWGTMQLVKYAQLRKYLVCAQNANARCMWRSAFCCFELKNNLKYLCQHRPNARIPSQKEKKTETNQDDMKVRGREWSKPKDVRGNSNANALPRISAEINDSYMFGSFISHSVLWQRLRTKQLNQKKNPNTA